MRAQDIITWSVVKGGPRPSWRADRSGWAGWEMRNGQSPHEKLYPTKRAHPRAGLAGH